jgi:hypothetical protein
MPGLGRKITMTRLRTGDRRAQAAESGSPRGAKTLWQWPGGIRALCILPLLVRVSRLPRRNHEVKFEPTTSPWLPELRGEWTL